MIGLRLTVLLVKPSVIHLVSRRCPLLLRGQPIPGSRNRNVSGKVVLSWTF